MIVLVIYCGVVGAIISPILYLSYRVFRYLYSKRKAARLPENLTDPEPIRISDISVGAGYFLRQSDLIVDKSRRVWVERNASISSPYGKEIYLKREANGWVLTLQDTVKLRPDRKVYWLVATYDPVVQIITATGS